MPVYEYGCQAGHRFEVKQKFSDAPVTSCQVCSLPVSKLISASAISFKGSGWYVTDYSNKMKPPETGEKTAKAAEAKDSKAESKEPKGETTESKKEGDKPAAAPAPPSTKSSDGSMGGGSAPASGGSS